MKNRERIKLLTQDPAVRYLLKMPGCDREEVESRLFFEEGFSDLLESAERDLLDQYVRNALPADLRHLIETELLFDERQRDKLLVAQILAGRTPRYLRYWVAATGIGIAAVLLVSASISYFHRPPVASRQVTPQIVQRPQHILTVLLTPGVLRGSGMTSFAIPSNTDLVHIELADVMPAQTYSVSLTDSSGSLLWQRDGLTSKDSGVTVSIPASLLKPGDFRISLSGQPARAYYFHVN